MPTWQLETSSPELTPPPGPAGANADPCLPSTCRSRGTNVIEEPFMGASVRRKAPAKDCNAPARKANRAPPKDVNLIAHGATWTPERVAQLKGCIGAGLSCSQIAG